MRTTAGLVVAALLGTGCYSYTEPRFGSPADVALAVGGRVQVDAVVQVVFLGVPADSRCPVADTLHTNLGPRSVSVGGYTITLIELTPYPEIPGPIPADQYRARLSIALAPVAVAPG